MRISRIFTAGIVEGLSFEDLDARAIKVLKTEVGGENRTQGISFFR